jgi:hypothetical protein
MMTRRQPNLVRAESYESEYRIVRPDGSVRLLHSWLDFDPGADGTMHVFGAAAAPVGRRSRGVQVTTLTFPAPGARSSIPPLI